MDTTPHHQQIQTLKARWEQYIAMSPTEGATGALQEKQQRCLEDFLHLLVAMSHSKGIENEDLLNFSSDIHSAFNILARKLMHDIQVEASFPPSTRADEICGLSRHLKYLMFDTGWLLLNALCTLSRQALSCKDEFILLLVALFEECLSSCSYDKQRLSSSSLRIPSLQKIFVTKKCRRSSSLSSEEFTANFHSSVTSLKDAVAMKSNSGSAPVKRSARSESLPNHKLTFDSSDSENEHRKQRSRRRSRPETLDHHHHHNHHHHRPERLSFSSAFPVYLFQCASQIMQRHVHVSGVHIVSQSTSVVDLSITLLSLLEGLCTSEVMHLASRNALGQFLAPYLTKFLSDLQQLGFTSDGTVQTDLFAGNLSKLQRLVLRLLLKLCLSSGVNHQRVSTLAKAGTISSLLSLAIAINKKLSVFAPFEKRPIQIASPPLGIDGDDLEFEADVFEESRDSVTKELPSSGALELKSTERDLTVVTEILEGILMILSTILFRCQDDQTVITQAVAMLWEFEVSDGFTILQNTILQLDTMLFMETCNGEMKEHAKECINDLACGLRKLVTAAKRAKLEYLHKFHCLKRSHQHCDYTSYMHHHHNLLGIPYTKVKEMKGSTSLMPSSPTETSASHRKCCLVRAVELCLHLIKRAHCPWTAFKILSVLDQFGICCCLPEEVLIRQILECLPNWSLSLSSLALKILAKLILEQLSGGNMDKANLVDLCDECRGKKGAKLRASKGRVSRNDGNSTNDASGNYIPLWEAVGEYKSLLIGQSAPLSILVAKHLAFLVRHGSTQLKQALYNKVYIPVFEHVNAVDDDLFGVVSSDVVPEAALQHCYCALPLLLKFNSAEELFLLQLGLPHAIHLIELDATRSHILKIFEVMVGVSQKHAEKSMKSRKRAQTYDSGLSAGTYQTSDLQSSSDEVPSSITDQAVIQLFFDIIQKISPWEGIKSTESSTELSPIGSQSSSPGDIDDKLKSYVWVSSPREQFVSQSIESAFSSMRESFPISPTSIRKISGSSSVPDVTSFVGRPSDRSSIEADQWIDTAKLSLCTSVWRTCSNIVSISPIFVETFKTKLETARVVALLKFCLRIFRVSLNSLFHITKVEDEEACDQNDDKEEEEENETRSRVMLSLGLVEAITRVLLNLKNDAVYAEVLQCLKDNLTSTKVCLDEEVSQGLVSSLMRIALDQPCDESNVKNHCVFRQHQEDDGNLLGSWEDIFETSDGQSDVSDPWSTEEGYDADSESDAEKNQEDAGFATGREEDTQQELLEHPEVCTTLLEVLASSSSSSSDVRVEATKVALRRLLTLSKPSSINKMSSMNRSELCRCDLVSVILDNYADVLKGIENRDGGVRCLLIELIAVLVENTITAMQLRRLLQLCDTEEEYILPELLKTLLSIACATQDRPNHCLSFPVVSKPYPEVHIQENHFNQKTAPSCNISKIAPLHLSLENVLQWPPLLSKGLSMSMWMKLEESPKKTSVMKRGKSGSFEKRYSKAKEGSKRRSDSRSTDQIKCKDQVHVFSVGTSHHCLEVWAGFRPSCLILRLSSNSKVLTEVQCTGIIPLGEWCHLALTYQEESSQNNKILGKITLVTNGQLPKPVTLETSLRSLPKTTSHGWLFIGQSSECDTFQEGFGNVQIGNMMLFNDFTTLNNELALHLYSNGPNYFGLSTCEGSQPRSLYSRHLKADHINSDLHWEFLNGKRGVDYKQFKESLILGYSPNVHHHCNIFKKTHQQGNTLSRVLPGKSSPREGTSQSPDVIQAFVSCHIPLSSSHHLVKAIHDIGGISTFLFFLAKLVECTPSPGHQADAVKLLMVLQNSSYSLASEFRTMSGPSMLAKVLISSKFKVGPELLKVLFDSCCSPAVIYYCTLTDSYKVHRETDCILQDEEIFTQLILNWRIWNQGDPSLFCLLLDAIQMLIKRNHPHRHFNFEKLQSVGLVQKLLVMCKERHDDDLPAVPPSSLEGLVRLIRTMLGLPTDPADPHLMAEISDFLLSTHPAVNTFVCHAPSSFYFNQHKFSSTVVQTSRSRTRTQSVELSDAKDEDIKGEDASEHHPSNGQDSPTLDNKDADSSISIANTANQTVDSIATIEDPSGISSQSGHDSQPREGGDFVILSMADVPTPSSLNNQDLSSFSSLGASEKNPSLNKFSSSLLDLLSDAIMSQSEANLEKILGIVIKLDTLIVLAHHNSSQIRTSVVKLIHVYFHVATEDHVESYLKSRVFHLLANQLHQYPASREQVEACLLVLFSRPVGLDDRLDFNDMRAPDEFSQMSTILLLSVLERCLHDPVLCTKTLCITLHLFEGVPVLIPVLLENGFIEAVVNVLAATSALCSDSACPEELDLLVENIQHVLASIANKVFYFNKPDLYQHFEDMMMLLGGLEERFRIKYGTDSLETEIILETQSYIFREVLEYFRTVTMATDSAMGKKKILMILNRTKTYAEQKYEQFKWQQQVGAPLPEERRFSAEVDNVLRGQRLRNESMPGVGMVSEQELTKRFQKLCLLSVRLVTQRDPEMLAKNEDNPDSCSTSLAKELFFLLSEALAATLEKKLGRSKQFESIAWASKETLRVQLAQLLCHMMSPNQDIALRIYTLQVAHVHKSKELLKSLLSVHPQASKFELFLFDLLVNQEQKLSAEDVAFGLKLVDSLKDSGFKGYNPTKCNREILDAAKEELKEAELEESNAREKFQNQRLEVAEAVITKMADLMSEVVGLAMRTTQVVALNQNTLRAKFLDHLRAQISANLDVRTAWQDLIHQVTHERAVWYQQNSYPSSWQLDPTEGPGRVRKRLQRCHLDIPRKFFLPEFQKKHEVMPSQPLAYLFDDPVNASSSSELKRRLQMNEKISRASYCTQVTPASEFTGDLLLGENDMYFVYEEASNDVSKFQSGDVATISWQYDDIKELHTRWYQLRDNAMEIFLTNGHTLLLAFESTEERSAMYKSMRERDLPNLLEVDDISTITRAWCGRQMTNFEYLMQLNKLAGRSFNDLMQYPVFPFVLAEYTTNELDLNSHDIYRDLSKPVAVQLKEMEERYKRNYQILKEEYERDAGHNESTLTMKPYHYGSHYSNSGITLQYLVRLPPFTGMFMQYQDNSFDLPDRTFHCVNTSWKLSSFQSTSDVKELISEFFFTPEFLINSEGFNYGKKQNGEKVNDVVLPRWARDNPHLFIEIHKQALESPHVSQHLHAWIDLVFGYKQTGHAAVDAISVYHPATYFGTDTSAIADPVRRQAVETMIKTYGQTPKQLFHAPHPTRLELEAIPITVSAASSALISQFTNKAVGGKAGIMMGIEPSREPLRHIRGMQWGSYVGSLAAPEPMVKWQQGYTTPPSSLVALPTGSVCALSKNQCLLVMFGKERGINSMQVVNIRWSAVLTWGYPDGILRLKHRQKQPSINLIQSEAHQQVVCCASLPDCRLLFVACKSGVILAYRTKYSQEKLCGLHLRGLKASLYGHTGAITAVRVCRPYSILVSASQDGTCIIWDLNRLCYVRSLCNKTGPISPVTTVEVSDVSGDIASVTNTQHGGLNSSSSELTLWSINARIIGRVTSESTILCLAFSLSPAGVSINSVVAGCQDGKMRFWSCLDLSPVRTLHCEDRPIKCLTFTQDSNFLFSSDSKGLVVAWGKKDHRGKRPGLETFLPS
ncbi:lysosomal-trafficking regulator-like isoform X3 [Apostichopus japonicus]|uniref:lysosomal-trafficking regulator-like isoform X3 n=1 Tax=Stichopus japonicus TaxID=307972 RepID=UPI003AB5AF66